MSRTATPSNGSSHGVSFLSAEEDVPEIYTGPLVSLRTITEALGRRKWLWLTTAILGLVIGAGFHAILPTKYSAITNLYLTEPASAGINGLSDDQSLLQTDTVAKLALSYYLHVPERDLRSAAAKSSLPGSYQGTPTSNIIMQIKATAPTPSEAVAWANAVAKAFFAVRNAELGNQTGLLVAVLDGQANQLNAHVTLLNSLISALSSGKGGPDTANEVAQLVTERSNDTTQITSLQQQIQQDEMDQNVVVKGSYVLDPATAIHSSKYKPFAVDGISGLIAGLALGMAIVIVGSVLSERPRRRSEIAVALGAPVELTFPPSAFPRSLSRRAFRRLLRRPTPQLRILQRRLRRHLAASDPTSLIVVPIGKTDISALAVASLGMSLAAEGKRVALVDMAEGRPLANLFKVRSALGAPHALTPDGKAFLVVAPEDPAELAPNTFTAQVDALVVLNTVTPAIGPDYLSRWPGRTVVMTRAGEPTQTLLEGTGHMLRQVGHGPQSVILLGGSPHDDSNGLLDREPADNALSDGEAHGARERQPALM